VRRSGFRKPGEESTYSGLTPRSLPMAVLLVLLASILLKKLRQLFILVTHQPGLFYPFGSLFWLAQIPEQIPFGVSYRCTDSICRVMTKSLHTWCCHRQVLAVVAKSGFLACAFCHLLRCKSPSSETRTPQNYSKLGPSKTPKTDEECPPQTEGHYSSVLDPLNPVSSPI
jgi:hypothetical protein